MLIGQEELYKQVLNFNNAIYVEAPAGCGKTHSCIKCVDILSNNGKLKDFQKVLILTFSKNARAQILNELSKYNKTESIYKHIEISNYHSFYKKYLDKYRDLLGFKKEFTIVDDDEYKEQFGIPKRSKIAFGDYYKLLDKYYQSSDNQEITDIKIIKNYNSCYNYSKETGVITFNMFGILINELFAKSPKLIELISHDFPYIFLDEYQDTDDLQENFLVGLFQYSKCIFIADPIQMIYKFKGASEDRLTKLKEFFPSIIEIKFEENYRYKTKTDIVSILENIRTGTNLSYANLINGKVFDVKIKLDGPEEFRTKFGNNIHPSSIFYSILNAKIIDIALKKQKSICILVRTNEMVNKLCLMFDENKYKCNEISDSKYMLKLNIILKKFFNITDKEEVINYALQIFSLCKYNKRIEDVMFENIKELSFVQFMRKRKEEFVKLQNVIKKYNLDIMTIPDKQKMISQMINTISKENKNYTAYNFVDNIVRLDCISEKNIDNIYTQKQYISSYTNIKPGLYVANYYQCKGREFDEVIVILDPQIEDLEKNRNILYVTHSRMKEKLFIGKYKFIGRK